MSMVVRKCSPQRNQRQNQRLKQRLILHNLQAQAIKQTLLVVVAVVIMVVATVEILKALRRLNHRPNQHSLPSQQRLYQHQFLRRLNLNLNKATVTTQTRRAVWRLLEASELRTTHVQDLWMMDSGISGGANKQNKQVSQSKARLLCFWGTR